MALTAVVLLLTAGGSDRDDRQRVATAFRDPSSVKYKSFKSSVSSACGELSADSDPRYRRFIVHGLDTEQANIRFEPDDPIRRAEDLKPLTDLDGKICAAGKAAFIKGSAAFPRLECSMARVDVERFAAIVAFTRSWAKCMMPAPEDR